MRSTALARIAVGVVVERRRARSMWLDFLWRPVSVLAGNPSAAPWSTLETAAALHTSVPSLCSVQVLLAPTLSLGSLIAA